MASPSEFGIRLAHLLDAASLKQVQKAMGEAAKKAATDAVKRDLGSDQRMSNMRSKAKLGADYDNTTTGVLVHLTPAGLWKLADSGRRRSGKMRPRRSRALRTPQGPRATSSYRTSRGLGTIDNAVKQMTTDVPEAAEKAVQSLLKGL